MKSRYKIFKEYEKYKQKFDEKNIDELCNIKKEEFILQPQQLFLKEYFKNNLNSIKQFLLYHEIGSGKTCTSIILAEDFLKINNNNRILVILPARLKNNFYDELISSCTNFKYFTKQEYNEFQLTKNDKLRNKFIKEIDKKYEIISYERFRLNCIKHSKNIIGYINNFTKDKMVIIDEVHNLISDTYNINLYINIETLGKLPLPHVRKTISINSVLIKLLAKYSNDSCKLIYLTATPIYDSIKELPELVYLLNPEKGLDIKEALTNASTNYNLEKLKGKISYFPCASKTAYPKPNIITHTIEMSKTQDKLTLHAMTLNQKDDNEKETFLSYQRQIAVSCLNKTYNMSKILENLPEYAPKIDKLYNIITSDKVYGKHVIYTSFINVGINVIEKVLINNGWKSIFEVYNNPEKWEKYENKVYAIWSGSESDIKKNTIKQIINGKDNIYGNKIKVLIGSPSIKEGISFKHIQHIHLLDPVWNMSGKKQIEGRAIRFCSHYDINEKVHKNLKIEINIHIYKLKLNKKATISETIDHKLYDKILPKKYEEVEVLENNLKKVAIDYHLFKKMYKKNTKSPRKSNDSNLSLDEKQLKVRKTVKNPPKFTCNPKIRRPDKNSEECTSSIFSVKRKNKYGELCCYKKQKITVKNTCPTKRRPIDGKCQNGLFKRKNKHGDYCCYKYNKI